MNNNVRNDNFTIERREARVEKMIRYIFDKLKTIDEYPDILIRNDNIWPHIASICKELPECCMKFVQDTKLIAEIIQYCLKHRLESRKQIGNRFLCASLCNDIEFFGKIVAEVLWELPTITTKKVSVDTIYRYVYLV